MYRKLTIVALFSVPIAAVIVFSWRVGTEIYTTTNNLALALVGGLAAAIGLESVGILAGHIMLEYYRVHNNLLLALSAAILVVYVLIGARELDGTIGETLYYISPLVYVLAGLEENLRQVIASQRADKETDDNRWEISRRYRHEEKMALIASQGTTQKPVKARTHAPHDTKGIGTDSHDATHVRTYRCESCGFETHSPQKYSAHMRWQHKDTKVK